MNFSDRYLRKVTSYSLPSVLADVMIESTLTSTDYARS